MDFEIIIKICLQLYSERSRFNRWLRQLIWLVQIIRQAMNTQLSQNSIVIIDSFSLSFCQPVRNH